MWNDNSLDVQSIIITHLQNYAPLTALVPADSIYGVRPPAEPSWPFIRYGSGTTRPYEASCWDGTENAITFHAFAEGDDAFAVGEISKQIVAAMESLTSPDYSFVRNVWTATNIIPDNNEATNWHSIINFEVTAVLVA